MAGIESGGLQMGPEFTFVTELTNVEHGEDEKLSRAKGFFEVPSLEELNDPAHPLHWMLAHFPNRVMVPGNIMSESLAQLLGYAASQEPVYEGKGLVLAGDDSRKFRREVSPGERLDLTVDVTRIGRVSVIGNGIAVVNEELAAQVDGIKLGVVDLTQPD